MKTRHVFPPRGPVLLLGLFALLSAMGILAGHFLNATTTYAQLDLTGRWNVAGGTNAGVQFTCVMNLVHDVNFVPSPTPTPASPTPLPPTPVPYGGVSGDIICTNSSGGTTSGTISGSFDQATRLLNFSAPGLFGCGSTQGRATVATDGNSMSNGTFVCDPVTIASWLASRSLIDTPTPTPTPASGTVVTFANNTGVTASDLHFFVVQPGMTLTADVVTNAPGCATPASSVGGANGPDFTFVVDVIWPGACVDTGESVELMLTCSNPGPPGSCSPTVVNNCSEWTLSGSTIGSPCPTPNCGGVPCCNGLPCPTPTATPATPTPTPTPTPSPTPRHPCKGNPNSRWCKAGQGIFIDYFN